MGNRSRKPNKNRKPITKSKIMAKVLPSFLTIIDSKEHFISHLKSIFSWYKKEFTNLVQAHTKNTTTKSSRRINTDTFTRSDFHYHDQSGELLHIYKLQLDNFVGYILETLKNIYYENRQIMKICIKDSEGILMSTLKETENLISGIFNESEQSSLTFVNLYQEKVMKDPIVVQFCSEENAIVEIKQLIKKPVEDGEEGIEKKKKDKRKRREEIEDNMWKIDLEVEEFRKKLEFEFINDIRERPNVTLDWIAGIKKKLVRA